MKAGQVRALARWLGSVASWFALLAVAGVIVLVVVLPHLAGGQPYAVRTGSMRPTLPPGTLIIVRQTPPMDLAIGDVITYQIASERPEVVTHRITALRWNDHGERTFTTRGDANSSIDSQPVRAAQIRGRLWYALPYLGYADAWLTGLRRMIIIGLVVAGLLAYATVMFTQVVRARVRRRSATPETVS
jgi:signal peptidase